MFKIIFSTGRYQEFETIDRLNGWLVKNINLGTFGKNDRWLRESDFTGNESTTTATDTRVIDGEFDFPVTEYFFPKEYTIDGPHDVTAEHNAKIEKQARMIKGAAVRVLCSNIMDSIIGFNMEASRTEEDLDEMTIRFSNITALLEKFRPFHAKPLIQNIQVDYLVSQKMKDEILSHYQGVI